MDNYSSAQAALPLAGTTPSTWRVTPSNPPREVDGIDYERCVALHNELLSTTVSQGGSLTDQTGADHPTWFGYHGAEAEEVRDRLSPSLARFLERARVTNGRSLFYFVNGLHHPMHMWSNHEPLAESEEERHRYLTLYAANGIASHPDGLVFDQIEHKAIMHMSIFDSGTTKNGRQQWHPLEVVLSSWLDMVDAGKAVVVPQDVELPGGRFDPWVLLPYSQQQLGETIAIFNDVVALIEARMPLGVDLAAGSDSQLHLSEDDLDRAHVPSGFARQFLSKINLPRFRYIAPGLEAPTTESITEQPFSSADNQEDTNTVFPVLLFRSDSSFTAIPSPYGVHDRSGAHLPFLWPHSEVQSYPAGLYFSAVDRESMNTFEDGVKLVLPFGIGAHGHARTADGARFGENKEQRGANPSAKNTYADLYQLGFVPFGDFHNVRLAQVLKSWRDQIISGFWEVGPEGVVGGLDRFKEADTEDAWKNYVTPLGW